MSKKTPEFAYLKVGDKIEETAFTKAVAAFAKEHEFEGPDAKEAVKHFARGGTMDVLDFEVIENADLKKAQKALYKAAEKFVADSAKNKEKLNEQIAAEEEAAAKQIELVKEGAETGGEKAEKFGLATVSSVQKMVGSKFVSTPTGLSIAKGATITPKDAGDLILTLSEASEQVDKVRSVCLMNLGEGVIAIREAFGEEEGDNIVQQAVEVRGKGKNNCMDAERVMIRVREVYPDQAERPEGLTFTHWQEFKNGGWNKKGEQLIKTPKLKSIVEKVVAGRDGKILSCAEMRELLDAARPQDATEVKDEEGGGEDVAESNGTSKELFGYLYLELANINNVIFSEELDKDLLKEKVGDDAKYHVMDLGRRAVIDQKGKVEASFVEEEAVPAGAEDDGDDLPE